MGKNHKHNKQSIIKQTLAQDKQNKSVAMEVNEYAIQCLEETMAMNDKSIFDIDPKTTRNILVVDNGKQRQDWFNNNLSSNDSSISILIDFADNTNDARKLINKTKYDLIFVWHDLKHPFMASIDEGSGYEFVYNNNITQNSNTPIILHGHNALGNRNTRNIARGYCFFAPFMFFNKCLKIKN